MSAPPLSPSARMTNRAEPGVRRQLLRLRTMSRKKLAVTITPEILRGTYQGADGLRRLAGVAQLTPHLMPERRVARVEMFFHKEQRQQSDRGEQAQPGIVPYSSHRDIDPVRAYGSGRKGFHRVTPALRVLQVVHRERCQHERAKHHSGDDQEPISAKADPPYAALLFEKRRSSAKCRLHCLGNRRQRRW